MIFLMFRRCFVFSIFPFLRRKMFFRFFRRQSEVLFFSFFVSGQVGKYGFFFDLFKFFLFLGYSFASFSKQSLRHSFPTHWLSTKFGHVRRFSRSSRQSMRPPMHYSDPNTAGPTPGQINIKFPRLIQRQDGQEHSANGTGPEETCAGRGGASGTARRRNASERPYCQRAVQPGRSGPDAGAGARHGAGCGAGGSCGRVRLRSPPGQGSFVIQFRG